LDREISPVAMWGAVAVVALVVIVAGYLFFGRNPGKLTPQEEQKAKQTIMQQYQGYFGPGRGGGR
jgi:hypothetical protein